MVQFTYTLNIKYFINMKEGLIMSNAQLIGFDCGRGYVKVFTMIGKEVKEVMFKSVIGDGRENKVEHKSYPDPIFIEYNKRQYFVGLLAEKESYAPIRNSKDSKISKTVEVLLAAALEQVAIKDKVKIVFGVPYKNYTETVLKEVINTYKGKTMTVKNKLTGTTKEVFIEDVDIFREADAALLHAIRGEVNEYKPVGLINIGFRTMELSYFDKGFNFNDKLSNTVEYGNSTILKMVRDKIQDENIDKSLNEIDSSDDYDDLKKEAYEHASEGLDQMIEEHWPNKDEMDLYLAGGTSLHLNPGDNFIKLPDAQTATAKGLYEYAKIRF